MASCIVQGVVHVQQARSAEVGTVMESLNVNYVAAQQIVATLLKRRHNAGCLRSVVVISSILSQFGARGHSLYCASKAALDGMVRALAVEKLAPDVRVNSVLPGAVRTPMAESGLADPEIASQLKRDYPLGVWQTRRYCGARRLPDVRGSTMDYRPAIRHRWRTDGKHGAQMM